MVPEKRFEDISENNLHEILQCNTIIPALWMKVLFRILKGKKDCVVSVLSARVGSIQDNHLGGWYSYRASKAALNMILKSLAIEYRRRAKNVKILAFHPGTTDTALSKPFQSSVASNKLFTPQFVAEKLSTIMDTIIIDGELSFLDWDGKVISW
jgi:NAD(P)-dependent dehydrogenase (short-subunit alcohol dehydrogenase family)